MLCYELSPQRPDWCGLTIPGKATWGRVPLENLCRIYFRKLAFKLSRGPWGKGLSFIIWMVEQARIWVPTHLGFRRDQIQIARAYEKWEADVSVSLLRLLWLHGREPPVEPAPAWGKQCD